MAAFDHIRGGMHDISLKPRLLRSLIKEKLPDEKHPFGDSSELLHVASTVRIHRLLSESASQSVDQKLMKNWKSAVDSWVNRLLILVSSNMPDKCWAGVCLLGVTCEECSPERFLASYSVWFNKLLSHIQQSAGESHFVKVASCASASDLFTRLSGFPNVKKDATSHAVKVIQPILKLLNEDNSDASTEGAICLLYTVTTFFPSAVHRHYDGVETAIVSKILSGKCSVNILKKLGHCLALLPKSKGDEDSWLLMMHKILISINFHLKDAFQGLEEETKSDEAMRLLVPPGKEPPTPLGGLTMSGTSYKATKRPELLLMCSVPTLMRCCCTMLTSSYPVQITVPVQQLLMLAGRVLMVDGSVSQTLFMTTIQQEFICSELPVLHLHSLELLTAIVKGLRSQLLPHVADIARLLTEYFRKCVLPELRTKVYSIIRILLMSMGVGMALYLTQDVISNTFIDLDFIGYTIGDSSSNLNSKISYEALLQPVQKKRKHVSTTGSLDEQPDKVGLEVMGSKTPTPMSVKIAALNTLEALLTVGGAIRSESWRLDVDQLLITIATDASKGGWAKEENNVFLPNGPTNTWAEFQLAALKALLASLLSPGRVRPPFLAQGLELFRGGMQETGTKLSEFCSHALLALEVLIHPRALPLIDFAPDSIVSDGLKHRFQENIYSGGPKFNTSFSGGTLGDGPFDPELDEDDLYKSWLGNHDEDVIAVPPHPGNNAANVTERPSVALEDRLADKLFSFDGSSASIVPQESGGREMPATVINGVRESGVGEIITKTRELQETIQYSKEAIAREDQTIHAVSAGSISTQSGRVILDSNAVETMDNSSTMGEAILTTKDDGFAVTDEKPLVLTSNFEKGKGIVFELDAESSEESIPDIVDEEPDSD